MTRFLRSAALNAALLALAACSERPPVVAPLDGSPPIAVRAGAPADDWTTFAHDQLRTGYQPQAIGISKANVAKLALRWYYQSAEPLQASPLVAGGRLYLASTQGTIASIDTATGREVWKITTNAYVAMTPALVDGKLFVGDHHEHGAMMALDAKTGKVLWATKFDGGVRSEPVIAGGVVYEGETGGDGPACHQGGVHALDERTGKELWVWTVDPHAHEGGSVWSPLSYDRGHIIFGTGNACERGIDAANAVVALDTSGRVAWLRTMSKSQADSDVGGGSTILHGRVIVTSKNGSLYQLDEATGGVVWSVRLASEPGYGGVGTPSTDGKTIVASAGYTSDPTKTAVDTAGGMLYGLDTDGHVLWTIPTVHPISGNAPINNGIAYTALDEAFYALDARTGAKLWTFDQRKIVASPPVFVYPSPVIVPSGVYFADNSGRVFAFSVPPEKRHA